MLLDILTSRPQQVQIGSYGAPQPSPVHTVHPLLCSQMSTKLPYHQTTEQLLSSGFERPQLIINTPFSKNRFGTKDSNKVSKGLACSRRKLQQVLLWHMQLALLSPGKAHAERCKIKQSDNPRPPVKCWLIWVLTFLLLNKTIFRLMVQQDHGDTFISVAWSTLMPISILGQLT